MEDLAQQGILNLFRSAFTGHSNRGLRIRVATARAIGAICRRANHWIANRIDTPVLILMYHRVTTLPGCPWSLAVSPANFREQISWLRSSYPILRLESDWSQVREPSVVITFDDGYADNVDEALPILEELEVPATFFITSGYVGSSQEFWWDDLERIVMGDHAVPPAFEYTDATVRLEHPTDTPAARKSLVRNLHPRLKGLDPKTHEEWFAPLRAWASVDAAARPSHRPMDREALMRLASSPFATIGAHTVSHPRLSALPLERQQEEIFGSKEALEGLIGRNVSVFAYPFGGRMDYSAETARLVEAAGFAKAVSTTCGQAHRWTDPFQIPRVWMGDWDRETSIRRLRKYWVL